MLIKQVFISTIICLCGFLTTAHAAQRWETPAEPPHNGFMPSEEEEKAQLEVRSFHYSPADEDQFVNTVATTLVNLETIQRRAQQYSENLPRNQQPDLAGLAAGEEDAPQISIAGLAAGDEDLTQLKFYLSKEILKIATRYPGMLTSGSSQKHLRMFNKLLNIQGLTTNVYFIIQLFEIVELLNPTRRRPAKKIAFIDEYIHPHVFEKDSTDSYKLNQVMVGVRKQYFQQLVNEKMFFAIQRTLEDLYVQQVHQNATTISENVFKNPALENNLLYLKTHPRASIVYILLHPNYAPFAPCVL